MLEHFLISQIFAFMLIFSRIGSALMVFPGLGEASVSTRIRLGFTLLVTFVLVPSLQPLMPPVPKSPAMLAILVISEFIIGISIGLFCALLMRATHVIGMIIAFQTSLSSSVIYDVTQSTQGSVIGNFLGVLAVVLLLITDMHLIMIRGIASSYHAFAPGAMPPIHDFVQSITHVIADIFRIAVQISAPLIVVGLLLFLSGGIVARLMPAIQIFSLITPAQLIICFTIFILTFHAMMNWYMEFIHDRIIGFMSHMQ